MSERLPMDDFARSRAEEERRGAPEEWPEDREPIAEGDYRYYHRPAAAPPPGTPASEEDFRVVSNLSLAIHERLGTSKAGPGRTALLAQDCALARVLAEAREAQGMRAWASRINQTAAVEEARLHSRVEQLEGALRAIENQHARHGEGLIDRLIDIREIARAALSAGAEGEP